MNESDSTNIFSNFTNEELLLALQEINVMDTAKIILLKQEFINREMFEESFAIDTFFSGHFDPSKLSLKEIQELVSERLQTGEPIESIKSDLADHGVTLAALIDNEGQRIDTVFEKIAFATHRGVNEEKLNSELKEKYNFTDEEIVKVKSNLKKRSIVYKISGICVVIFAIAFFLLTLYLGKLLGMFTAVTFLISGLSIYANGVRLSRK